MAENGLHFWIKCTKNCEQFSDLKIDSAQCNRSIQRYFMTLFFVLRKSQRRPREKTYDFIQIRKDDDEAKTKKDVVSCLGQRW